MNVPPALIHSLQHTTGFDKEAFEKVHSSGEQITTIRLNNNKLFRYSSFHSMDVLNDPAIMPVPWSTHGYQLSQRPSFTLDPLFHAGAYYVQEASSMFLEEILKQSIDLSRTLKVLDLCAAPGGKSTLIQSMLSTQSLLVCNEVIKTRVQILSENIIKWGAANVIVTNNDPKDFQRLPGYFDVIVVDAPCSGSGLFRKDPASVNEWSEQQVSMCSNRQQRILTDVLPALKEGGILIYSTCSYSEEENEAVAGWLIREHPLTTLRYSLQEDWNIIETTAVNADAYCYRFYPHRLKGEGFFIAGFKKDNADIEARQKWKAKASTERPASKQIEVLKLWLKNTGDFFFTPHHEEIIAVPVYLEKDLEQIKQALYIKKAGVKIGTVIRNELIPSHELALSNIFHPGIQVIDVDSATALQYLRRQDINLNTRAKGWALLTFHHLPLGWIKVLPNRINNYYPKDWRILNK